MKAKIAALLSAVLILAVGFAAACAPSEPAKVKMIFDSNGGSAVQTIEQDAGSEVTEPAAPEKDGYTFEFWCSDQALSEKYVFSTMPESDITLYAKWKANTYSLTFELNGGAFASDTEVPVSYATGTAVTLPVPAARTGFDFGGWFADATYGGSAVTSVTAGEFGNKTFYAKWTPSVYDIEYVLNGLDNDPANPTSYVFGEGAELLPAVNKGDLGFMGWYDNAEFTGTAVTEIDIDSTGKVTLYAKVQQGVYAIKYENLLGGTHGNPSYYVSEDGLVLTDASREFYDFVGWFDEDDVKVETIAPDTTGAYVLTAKWSATEYSIVYNTEGGVFDQGAAPETYTVEDDRAALPYPFKTGFAFLKWVDGKGNEVTEFGGGTSGNIEVTAQYREASGVQVESDGTVTRFTKTDDGAIVIPDNAIKINDHILYGDQTDSSDQNANYNPKSLFIGKASRLEYIGNFSFYYTSNTSDGNWNPTGEFEKTTLYLPSSLKYIGNYAFTDLPFDFVLPEKNSLEFIGGGALSGTDWAKAISADQEYVYFGKVLYKYQGGATAVNNIAEGTVGIAGSAFQSKADIVSIDIPDTVLAIGDNAFAGCVNIAELNIPSSVRKVFYNLFEGWTADQVVYLPFEQGAVPAEWDVNWSANTAAVLAYTKCNITYHANGGNNAGAPTQYETGKELDLPVPTKPGFRFDGWFLDETFGGDPIAKITSETRGEIVLYAKWTMEASPETEYTITLATDGGELSDYELKYKYGDDPVALPYPLKAGYAFIKWIDEGGAEITEYGGDMAGDRTFTAVYEQGRGYTTPENDTTVINGWTPMDNGKIVVADDILRFQDHPSKPSNDPNIWNTTEFFIGKNSRLTYVGDFSVQNMAFVQTDLHIPATVEHIGVHAFSYSNLRLRFAEGMPNLKYIGGEAFLNGAWYNLILPTIDPTSNDVYIGNVYYKNRNMAGVSTVEFKPGTVAIAGSAFDGATNITSLVIPDTVTAIGDRAFGRLDGTVPAITEITVPASVLKMGASVFGGWTSGQTVNLPFAQGAAPADWNEHWAEDTEANFVYTGYNIVYVLNGGDNASGAPAQYETGRELDLPIPTKAGFRFDGWFLDEGFSGEPIAKITSETRGEVTVYAKWTLEEVTETEYTITLATDGGELSDYELKYKYGDDPVALPYPLKAGYAFIKWVDQNETEVTEYGGEMSGNKTFTAVYEEGRGYISSDGKTVNGWKTTADNKIVVADDITRFENWAINGNEEGANWGETEFFIGKNSRLTYIGDFSVQNMSFIQTEVYIPATVEHIGIHAFSYTNLRYSFADGMPNLKYIGVDAFLGGAWYNLDLPKIDPDSNDVYIGNVYYMNRNKADITTVEFRAGTVAIAGGAFATSTNITSIVIPETVVALGENAFGKPNTAGPAITEITVPASVQKTGYGIFGGWTSSQTVNLPFAEGAAPAGWDGGWNNPAETQATFVYAQV